MSGVEFDLGIAVLSRYSADGFLGVAIDHYGDSPGGPPGVVHNPFGFAGRPLDPDVDTTTTAPYNGCTLLYYREGKRYGSIVLGDPRHLPPQVAKGGSVHYCAVAGAYAKFEGGTGAYTLAIPSGQSATFQAAGGPSVVIDANGLTVGTTMQVNAKGFTAGGRATLDDTGLAVTGSGPAQPLALGPALQALIAAVQQLSAGTCSGVPLSTAPLVQAALAAITQVQTSVIRGSSQ